MEVGALVKEPDLGVVAAMVVVVADVQGLVDIRDEMDEEQERPLPFLFGSRSVGQDLSVLLDLDDHVVVVANQAGIESGIADRHVDEVPFGAPGHGVVPLLVGPACDIRQGVRRDEQFLDRGLC